MGLFKKKIVKKTYDREHMKPVIRASICTGEEVAGFKDIRTGRIEEIMLIRSPEDLEKFKEIYEIIRNNIGIEQKVSITYFIPDAKKAGGSYVTYSGIVKKIDEYEHTIIMTDQTVIPIEQISEIRNCKYRYRR